MVNFEYFIRKSKFTGKHRQQSIRALNEKEFNVNESQKVTAIQNQNSVVPNITENQNKAMEQNFQSISKPEILLMVSMINDRVQNTKIPAINDNFVPRVKIVRCDQFGSSRAPESLVYNVE